MRPMAHGTVRVKTARAGRLMALRSRVIAEGARAAPVACALAGKAGPGKIVGVGSGGNIDARRRATVLTGGPP